MTLRRLLACLYIAALTAPLDAQTTEDAPLIQIAPAPGTLPAPSGKSPEIQITPGGAAPPAQSTDAPEMKITPETSPLPAAEIGVAPTVAPGAVQAGASVPMTRDAVADATAATPEPWTLPLVPVQPLIPTEVRIGGSTPVPGQFRLSGEVASAEFVLNLPAGMTPPAELLLSLRSSANVLSDLSALTVWVNGVASAPVPLDNIGDFADCSVPITGLVAGANAIRLAVKQTHRIFCGPDASFGVWTEVKLGRSGLSFARDALPVTGEGFIAALRSQIATGGALDIRAEAATDGQVIRSIASKIVEAVGGAPAITVSSFYVVQKTSAARAQVALIPAVAPKASVRRGADGTMVLKVEYTGTTIPDLSNILPPAPVETPVPNLTPGQAVPLSDLGFAEILGNTHYFRQDVDFMLPEAWLLLASQKAVFTLHYGFSADLPPGALLLVKINGETIGLLPLDRKGGKVLPPLEISFRANRLNPGTNAVTFEMSVPGDPADLPCTPRTTDMLVVLGDSTLMVPPSPRMQQPDIARSLAALDGAGVTIPPQAADPAGYEATLIAFGALFRPLVTRTDQVALHIVGINAAGLVPKGATDLSRRTLQTILLPPVDSAIPVAQPKPAVKFTLADGDGMAAPAAPQPVAAGPSWRGWIGSSDDWLREEAASLRGEVFPGTAGLDDWLTAKHGQAVLLQLDADTPNDIWLVVGPGIDLANLARQIDLFRRGSHHDLTGQAALLQNDGTWSTWSQNRAPQLLEPLSLSYLRPVLGNYASWAPALFTLLTLAFALLSAVPALIFVLITRRKGSRT